MDYTKVANSRYASGVFINKPTDGPAVEVIYNKMIKDTVPVMSVVIPIYNQERIIERNLKSVLDCMTHVEYELILIVDACSDKTEERVMGVVNEDLPELLTNVVVMKTVVPLFETAADNLGFLCSRGEFVLEIQADMQMVENGFNMTLVAPFMRFGDLIAVSGRCCHGLTYGEGVGKMGADVEKPLDPSLHRGYLYISETCNRGPILFRRNKVAELGYLDEVNYFLDYSEHDLFVRARVQKSWLCGYTPMEFVSPCSDGSTRNKRDPINEAAFAEKSARCQRQGFMYSWLESRPEQFPIRAIPIRPDGGNAVVACAP